MNTNFPVVWHRTIGTPLRQREWSETPLFKYHRASMAQKSNSVPERVGLAPDQNVLARSSSLPPPPNTLLCPAQNTWHGGGGIWPRWLPPAAHCVRQLGCLALPLHQLPVAPPRCRGRGAMNYLVLQLQTWFLSKKCSSVGSTRQTRAMHTDAQAEWKGDDDISGPNWVYWRIVICRDVVALKVHVRFWAEIW